jgi:hypothetical protein
VVLEIERAVEEPVEQSMLPAMNDDVEDDNDIDDNNIEVDHDDVDDDNDTLLRFCSINDSSAWLDLCHVHWWLRS